MIKYHYDDPICQNYADLGNRAYFLAVYCLKNPSVQDLSYIIGANGYRQG